MAKTAPKSPCVALDTNFLLDLANGDETCMDCLEVLRQARLAPVFVVTATVLQELAYMAQFGEEPNEGELARTALQSLIKWGFKPVDFIPVGHGIVERISDELRAKALLPYQERNDSLILAEAALSNCEILISSDHHLTEIDREALKDLLASFDVQKVNILWPKFIISKLGRK